MESMIRTHARVEQHGMGHGTEARLLNRGLIRISWNALQLSQLLFQINHFELTADDDIMELFKFGAR